MFRRLLVIFLVSAIVGGMPNPSTFALEDSVAKPDIKAVGSGYAHLACKGNASIKNNGSGFILIRHADEIKFKILGKGKVVHIPGTKAILIWNLKGIVKLA